MCKTKTIHRIKRGKRRDCLGRSKYQKVDLFQRIFESDWAIGGVDSEITEWQLERRISIGSMWTYSEESRIYRDIWMSRHLRTIQIKHLKPHIGSILREAIHFLIEDLLWRSRLDGLIDRSLPSSGFVNEQTSAFFCRPFASRNFITLSFSDGSGGSQETLGSTKGDM